MLSHETMEWKEDLHTKEQTREARLSRRPPNLFQFPDHGRVLRCITPISTHLLRVWNVRTWRPALCPGTEKLTHLPPYKLDAWCRQLERHGLLGRYPDLYLSLIQGFDVGVPSIQQTYIPPNSSLVNKYLEVYEEIVETEFWKGRYLGPFSKAELKSLIGPFQSSPLSLVTKPGKPGKYHMVHDFSHLRSTCTNLVQSINSAINSQDFPCTWGTFSTICLVIYCLPPGSQASIRDVSKAYRTIPVHHSQWRHTT